jgi:hypothetical protein
MMHRFKASAALLLTAFFAVAGSFHHHPIPKPTHDHAGFCSASSVGIALESCALCRVAHTPVQLAARAIPAIALDSPFCLSETATRAPSAGRSLLSDPRAPPAV